jgi:hypothetical protein
MHQPAVNDEDLELLYNVIDSAIEEATFREIELTVTELTFRLFAAYAMGERDHERLVDAVLYAPSHYVH